VPDADAPTLLCTAAQFVETPFADLARDYTTTPLADVLTEATRLCESEVTRRLVPFTKTESHRAEGIDPDELTDSANLPMDILGTLGRSYAMSLGSSTLVRKCWLNEYAPIYEDLWTYSGVSISITRSFGGSQPVTTLLSGPEPDSGQVWFQLGTFLPIGSLVKVTYSGGYTVAIPADLVRAGRFMAAYLIVRELNPADSGHDAEELHADALLALEPWKRA
jgi:hypothetical protein